LVSAGAVLGFEAKGRISALLSPGPPPRFIALSRAERGGSGLHFPAQGDIRGEHFAFPIVTCLGGWGHCAVVAVSLEREILSGRTCARSFAQPNDVYSSITSCPETGVAYWRSTVSGWAIRRAIQRALQTKAFDGIALPAPATRHVSGRSRR
jgi:hypothetical protein